MAGRDAEAAALRVARLGVVPIVRVPATERFLISSVLDAGAIGVVVPWVESAEQARRIVDFAKYPPEGKRGVGPFHADEMDGDLVSTMATMNREQLLVAMVETVAGIENVDEIAAVDGIDLLWLGHGDLTTSLGIPGQFDNPLFLDAVERIFSAAEAQRKGGRDSRRVGSTMRGSTSRAASARSALPTGRCTTRRCAPRLQAAARE